MTLNTDALLAKYRFILGWKGALEVIWPNALLKADSTVQLHPASRWICDPEETCARQQQK